MAHSSETQLRINQCLACHRMCEETVAYCLERGGDFVTQDHVQLLMDCAELSQTAANFMLRESAQSSVVCAAAAEICRRCAADCDRYSDDHQMKACAEVCRRCAEACERIGVAHSA